MFKCCICKKVSKNKNNNGREEEEEQEEPEPVVIINRKSEKPVESKCKETPVRASNGCNLNRIDADYAYSNDCVVDVEIKSLEKELQQQYKNTVENEKGLRLYVCDPINKIEEENSFHNQAGNSECGVSQQVSRKPVIKWLSEEEENGNDDELGNSLSEICTGMQEPPTTAIAKDELALRRHRFFLDLIDVTKNLRQHRVKFDPLGPLIHPGGDSEQEDRLEELIIRLESITKRLEIIPSKLSSPRQEDIAVQIQQIYPNKAGYLCTTEGHQSIGSSIIKVDDNTYTSSDSALNVTMSIASYEDLLVGPVADYLRLSEKIGSDVVIHSKLVEKAFHIQMEFIKMAASRCAPANQSEQMALLSPTSLQIQAIQDYREKHRGSNLFHHLSAISESIPALGWVAVSPTPAPYVKEMNDAGQFYTNRVLKEWKEKDKIHVEWCKAWIQILTELQKYIKQYHTTGLIWAKSSAVPPPPIGGMPPPPPSMPIGDTVASLLNDDRSALFAQINQGENITRNLKKVTADMQTHKNASLRTGPAPFKLPVVVSSNSNSSPMKSVILANAPIDKPPVFTRDGKKWLIEYHKGNKDLLIDNPEMNNVVYMYRCQDCTLIIKGKINSIVMDSCRKSSIVFDSVVSSIEFVNCQSVQMQVLGKVPTISIDKTDGCQMYLNSESLHVEFITSKSSEMNVMVPKGNGDYTEYPIPEQFKTTVSPKGLTTIAVDALG